ncbi:MAG: phosphate acyltransferase PlsX [Clostridia bacterium]|nr:phosphate acyltransferase PlsX [Clostridia bacterium]
MKIIIDAFGGDYCPEVPVKASIAAIKERDIEIVLTGDKEKLQSLLKEYGCSDSRISVIHAPEVIHNEEKPALAVREKKESSVVVGAKLLHSGEGNAFVSAGSTGAVLAASLFNTGRIKGVRRPALAVVLPAADGKTLLLDCGANTGCKVDDLVTFAVMGSIYMKCVEGVANPRVALLSNGTEEGKGDSLVQEAYSLLKSSELNFTGNVEGRDIMLGGADVVVCDGFAGNVALKSIEGTAKMISGSLKELLFKNMRTKLGALLLKNELSVFSRKFNYKEYGGAPLLGIKAPVIKAHGSSDVTSFLKAILQAESWVKENVNSEIGKALSRREE